MGKPLYDNEFFLPTIQNILIVKKTSKITAKKFKNLSYIYTVKANYLNQAVK